jgi:hypothetical protein
LWNMLHLGKLCLIFLAFLTKPPFSFIIFLSPRRSQIRENNHLDINLWLRSKNQGMITLYTFDIQRACWLTRSRDVKVLSAKCICSLWYIQISSVSVSYAPRL